MNIPPKPKQAHTTLIKESGDPGSCLSDLLWIGLIIIIMVVIALALIGLVAIFQIPC